MVSVVLRTYDHARFVAQAIESVLIQDTAFRFELVIGEDCSTDGTREIVTAYAERHPQTIRAVLPERNIGHGAIFKRALEATRGPLIAYLDGDDYWTSRYKLTRQVDFLELNPECASCFHDVSLVYDEAGLPSGTVSPRFGEGRFTLEQILMECFVPAPSVIFRREVAAALPDWVFDSSWIDWLIHIKAAQIGPIGYLPAPLAAYRVHGGGMFSAMDRVSQLEEDVRFFERLLAELPDQRALLERCIAYRYAQLAIERLGVPLDSCVVLADPRHELRPYFNGRHARNLPRREGHEVTELQAIREAAKDLPPAVRDYAPLAQAPNGQPGCYLVVPRGSREWLRKRSQLSDYLDANAELAWEDEWVVVHELEPLTDGDVQRGARATRRVTVTMLESATGLPAGFLDAPASGALLPAHAVPVAGWALGPDGPPTVIEFEADGEVIWRAPVQVERPDVIEANPELAPCTPGFQTTLNAEDLAAETLVVAFAAFPDGSRMSLAELRLRAPAGEPTAS
jgi:Glycosyl transferase family 2